MRVLSRNANALCNCAPSKALEKLQDAKVVDALSEVAQNINAALGVDWAALALAAVCGGVVVAGSCYCICGEQQIIVSSRSPSYSSLILS